MEEDLVKKGILKVGEINENTMINSPEKLKKVPLNIFKTLSILFLVMVGLVFLCFLYVYVFCKLNGSCFAD